MTGRTISTVARGNAKDVAKAVASAHEGFQSWMSMKPLERGRLMLALSDILLAHMDALNYLESLVTGKPLTVARNELLTCARYFEYFGGMADKIMGETPAVRHALTTSMPELQCTSTSRINRNISSSPYRFRAITILLKITETSKNDGSVLGGKDNLPMP